MITKELKLITEFMDETLGCDGRILKVENKIASWVDPQYDSSWEWLSPVIDACSNYQQTESSKGIFNKIKAAVEKDNIVKAYEYVMRFLEASFVLTPRLFSLSDSDDTDSLGLIEVEGVITQRKKDTLKEGLKVYKEEISEHPALCIDEFIDWFNSIETTYYFSIRRSFVESI